MLEVVGIDSFKAFCMAVSPSEARKGPGSTSCHDEPNSSTARANAVARDAMRRPDQANPAAGLGRDGTVARAARRLCLASRCIRGRGKAVLPRTLDVCQVRRRVPGM